MDYFKFIINLLIIVGSIAWGVDEYYGIDIVSLGCSKIGHPEFEKYIKYAIGAAGVWRLWKVLSVNYARL